MSSVKHKKAGIFSNRHQAKAYLPVHFRRVRFSVILWWGAAFRHFIWNLVIWRYNRCNISFRLGSIELFYRILLSVQIGNKAFMWMLTYTINSSYFKLVNSDRIYGMSGIQRRRQGGGRRRGNSPQCSIGHPLRSMPIRGDFQVGKWG